MANTVVITVVSQHDDCYSFGSRTTYSRPLSHHWKGLGCGKKAPWQKNCSGSLTEMENTVHALKVPFYLKIWGF